MSKRTGLAWLTAASTVLGAALLLLSGLGVTSRAEVQVGKVIVDPVDLTVSEPTGSGVFAVSLNGQPAAPVYVDLSISGDECTVSPLSIEVNATNWDSGATATVTAVDDPIVDGTQSCRILTEKSRSADPVFDSINVRDVRVTVYDDDVAGIDVSPTSLTISEPDGSDTFVLTLTSQPSGTVSIPLLAVGDECTVSPASADLDTNNWDSGVIAAVTAVDDGVVDGPQICLVETGPATGGDANYVGLNANDVTVTVQDDDVHGIIVSPTSLTISEPDGSDTFSLKLTSAPTAKVSVGLEAVGDECTVSPAIVDLDAGNWDSGATATVTAADDPIADGPQSCVVWTKPATSGDSNYAGKDPEDVSVTVNDDDSPNIIVSPTSLTISEPDGSDLFALRLTTPPTAKVSIPLSAVGDECTVSPAVVDLDAGNWDSGATAIVTAIDDSIKDGPQTCVIETDPATSGDSSYVGLDPDNVTVTVQDDDVEGIVVAPTSLAISEPDGSDVFFVRLTSEPLGIVFVGLEALGDECTVSPASIELNATNWAGGATATVTAVDDLIADGPQTCVVWTKPATSGDPNYAGLDPDDVNVTVYDDEAHDIMVNPTSLTISEPSGSDIFVLTLTSRPSAVVSVDLSAVGDECTVSPASLELNADNWDSGATATVTAVDDAVADGPQICMVLTDPAISSDPGYDGRDPDDVTVTVYDNDTPGIVASPASLTIEELGGSDTFALALTSPPSNKVSIPLSVVGDECTVSPGSVDLDAANWSTGVLATVTAVDDDIVDGPQPCVVRSGPAISEDPVYHGRRGNNVTATVVDDDEAGIKALPTGLFIAEPAGFDTFTVKLTSQPLSMVSVNLTAVGEQCTVLPTSADLDADNWSSGVVATVTAVDDDIDDGSQPCVVHTGPANSSDFVYQGLSGADITVIVDDDDQAGIDVSDTSLSVREPAGTDSFILRLTSQPIASVSVSLSAVGDQCTVSPSAANLNATNWSAGVVATVTAVDDDVDDGTQPCVVHTGPASSTDILYQGRSGADVSVNVHDDDTAGITVDTSGMGTISEPDGSDTFTLKLNSQPMATVSINLSTSGEQCTVSPASVDLDAGNWSSGVVATVTAVDDDIDDDIEPCLVQTTRTSSGDPKYDDLFVNDVMIMVDDDDEAGIDVLPSSLAISEPDGSDTFSLRLASQPTAKVSIGLSVSGDECEVEPASVDLDAGNWAGGATATVTAVNDDLEDGTQTCMVLTDSASSADDKYQNYSVADVTVTVWDDDAVYRVYMPLLARRWPPIPDATTLYPVDNADGDGAYTVRWSPAVLADTYILEESTDSTFADVDATYYTPSTSYGISAQGAARYYYRVKARNNWGDSGWSTVQRVDVLWHWEGNDEPGDNGPVASGLTYFGILPNASDERDYFSFELTSPHQVELRLTNIPTGQNYDLALRDTNLNTFPGWYSVQPGNSDEHVLTGVLPAGTYYIQVYRNPDSSGGTSQAYHLWVKYE